MGDEDREPRGLSSRLFAFVDHRWVGESGGKKEALAKAAETAKKEKASGRC